MPKQLPRHCAPSSMLQDAGVPAVHVAVMFPVYGEVFQMKPVVQLT